MPVTAGEVYTLKADVVSAMRSKHIYALAGETVTIISVVEHVAIAESAKGVKMPLIIDDHLKLT